MEITLANKASLLETLPSYMESSSVYPYETKEFYQCWWDQLAPRFRITEKVSDFLVHRKPVALKGLLYFNELRLVGWNNAWSQDLTSARVDMFKAISDSMRWDFLKMTWNSTRESYQAFQQLEDLGFQLIQVPAALQYTIDITQGWGEYLKSKSQRSRKDIKRKLKLAEPLNPEIVPFEGTSEEFFDLFFRLHITYWDNKAGFSYFNNRCERNFIVSWAKSLERSGNLCLKSVRLGNELVNISMNAVFGDTVYCLLTINTGCYLDYYPGLLALYLRLQKASEFGIRTFKLGIGNYPYKIQASTHKEPCFTLIVPNPKSIKGKAYAMWVRGHLKSAHDEC